MQTAKKTEDNKLILTYVNLTNRNFIYFHLNIKNINALSHPTWQPRCDVGPTSLGWIKVALLPSVLVPWSGRYRLYKLCLTIARQYWSDIAGQ